MYPPGVFVLHCINERWPRQSCERETLNLFANTDEERDELRRYVETMYEVFDEGLDARGSYS